MLPESSHSESSAPSAPPPPLSYWRWVVLALFFLALLYTPKKNQPLYTFDLVLAAAALAALRVAPRRALVESVQLTLPVVAVVPFLWLGLILNGATKPYYPYYFLRFFLVVLASQGVLGAARLDLLRLLRLVALLSIIQALACLAEFLNAFGLRDVILNWEPAAIGGRLVPTFWELQYRVKGLYGGYASAGFMMAFFAMLCVVGRDAEHSPPWRRVFTLGLSVDLLAILATSRSGVLLLVVGLGVIWAIHAKFRPAYLARIAGIGLVVGTMIAIAWNHLPEYASDAMTLLLDPLRSVAQGSLPTSFAATLRMIPVSSVLADWQWWLGSALEPWVPGGPRSDVGYTVVLEGAGVLGLAGLLLLYLQLIPVLGRLMKNATDRVSRSTAGALLAVVPMLMLGGIKAPFFIQLHFVDLYFLLLVALLTDLRSSA